MYRKVLVGTNKVNLWFYPKLRVKSLGSMFVTNFDSYIDRLAYVFILYEKTAR